MSRTQGKFESDSGWNDGQIFISALDMDATSGTTTPTRNAAGDYSVNIGASQTCVLVVSLSNIIFRYGVQDYLQEQFGSTNAGGAQGLAVAGYTTLTTASAAAGNGVNIAVVNSANFSAQSYVAMGTAAQIAAGTAQYAQITAIPDSTHITVSVIGTTLASGSVITQGVFTTPAGVTGIPPFSSNSATPPSWLNPTTAPRPKGIQFKEIYPWYSISGAALTTNTIGITKTLASNNIANTATNILANAANGLATATQANPYLTPIQIASPAYQMSKYASYNVEWDVTTGAGGAARIYGLYMDVAFNWN
jgi:hypothetical protein